MADDDRPDRKDLGRAMAARAALVRAVNERSELWPLLVDLAECLLRDSPTDMRNVAEARLLLSFADLPDAIRGNGSELLPYRAKVIEGYLNRGLGDANAAIAAFKKAYDWRPDLHDAALLLAEGLEMGGFSDEAQKVKSEHAQLLSFNQANLPQWTPPIEAQSPINLYLDLLEKTVCNTIYGDPSHPNYGDEHFDIERRAVGRDLPILAHTMIGAARLRQLRWAAETIIRESVQGDIIEAGVWRGGACILVKGVLEVYQDRTRRVFVADSFAGLPPPDPRYPKDAATLHDFHNRLELAVSRERVAENFSRYDLLDDRVVFVEGLFKDTLPTLNVHSLSILRIDGDLYSSTMDALEALYERLSPGGFLICDDYGIILDAQRAILDFRAKRSIDDAMYAIDLDGMFWRKGSGPIGANETRRNRSPKPTARKKRVTLAPEAPSV